MKARGGIGVRAIALGLATDWEVREAQKLQLEARVLSGIEIGLAQALEWQGVITPWDVERLCAETGGGEGAARDRYGRLHFGEVALAKGFISAEQLDECLEVQRFEDAAGRHRLLGEILVRCGCLGEAEARDVIETLVEQRKTAEDAARLARRAGDAGRIAPYLEA